MCGSNECLNAPHPQQLYSPECLSADASLPHVIPLLLYQQEWGSPRKPTSYTVKNLLIVYDVNSKTVLEEDTGASHAHPRYSLKNLE